MQKKFNTNYWQNKFYFESIKLKAIAHLIESEHRTGDPVDSEEIQLGLALLLRGFSKTMKKASDLLLEEDRLQTSQLRNDPS